MCGIFLCHQLGTSASLSLSDAKIMCPGHTETCKVAGMTGKMNHEWCGGSVLYGLVFLTEAQQPPAPASERNNNSRAAAPFPLEL